MADEFDDAAVKLVSEVIADWPEDTAPIIAQALREAVEKATAAERERAALIADRIAGPMEYKSIGDQIRQEPKPTVDSASSAALHDPLAAHISAMNPKPTKEE